MNSWIQISGTMHALPARRGDEEGTYLWIDAGEHREHLEVELFLAAVAPDRLDAAMGVGVGMVRDIHGEHSGSVRLEFGRVREATGWFRPAAPASTPTSALFWITILRPAGSAPAVARSSSCRWWR